MITADHIPENTISQERKIFTCGKLVIVWIHPIIVMLHAVSEAGLPQTYAPMSELDEPIWSVISFERVEQTGLKYSEAVLKMSDLESRGVPGLCIVTNETAARIKTQG